MKQLFAVLSLCVLTACGSGGSSGNGTATVASAPKTATTGAILGLAGNSVSNATYSNMSSHTTLNALAPTSNSFALENSNRKLAKEMLKKAMLIKNNKWSLTTSSTIHLSIPSTDIDCMSGGKTNMSGSMDMTLGDLSGSSFNMDYEMTINTTYTNCKTVDYTGETYTVNGNMDITSATGHMYLTASPVSFSMTSHIPVKGTITVSGSTVSLSSCVVDMTADQSISGDETHASISSTYSGTMCGTSVSGSAY